MKSCFSEPHRNALLKMLNQAHVCHEISMDNWDHVIGNLVAANYISVSDNEIPSEGTGHISAKCKGYAIAKI